MRTYLISYDIPSHQRHALASALMQLGEAWARPLESTWYVQSTERADAIERRLRPLADAAEGLLIQEVDARALLLNTALRWFRRRQAAAGVGAAEPVALAA
jgi:hypothetical protein